MNGIKKLSFEVPTTTAQDAEALEALLLRTALEQELVHTTPLRVVTAPLRATTPPHRLVNFVTHSP